MGLVECQPQHHKAEYRWVGLELRTNSLITGTGRGVRSGVELGRVNVRFSP